MIPSICSSAAANISLASDIISRRVNLKQYGDDVINLLRDDHYRFYYYYA